MPHEVGTRGSSDDDYLVEVIGVAKHFEPLASPFGSATTLGRVLFSGRGASALVADDGLEDDDEDDEDDEDLAGDDREIWAVRDLSFSVAAGRCLGIVGPARSGKSTVLRLVAGVTPPTAGRIILRGRVGALSSVAPLFMRADASARDNAVTAALAAGLHGRAARQAADSACTLLDFDARQPAPGISGLRLLGAAVTVTDPADVVALDDLPTSDPLLIAAFADALRGRLSEGAAVLLAARDLRQLGDLCDEIVELRATDDATDPASSISPTCEEPSRDALTARAAEATPAARPRHEFRPGGRTHPALPRGKPGRPGMGFHQWAALLSVSVSGQQDPRASLIVPGDPLDVTFAVETGVHSLRIHWSVAFMNADGEDLVIEQQAPLRYTERTVSRVTVRIDAGTIPPGTFVGRVEGLISSAERTHTIRRDAFALVVAGVPPARRRRSKARRTTTVDHRAATWTVTEVPSPVATLIRVPHEGDDRHGPAKPE